VKVAIYTAIAGRFDVLHEPRVLTPGADFVCFSDSPIESDAWDVRELVSGASTPRRKARDIKLRPHVHLPGYDAWVWLDGCYHVRHDLTAFIASSLRRHDLALRRHPWRKPSCVYAEAKACIEKQKGVPKEIRAQMRRYVAEGMPVRWGVFVTGILLRRNTAKVRAFCDEWWREICNGSDRDQLSFPFVAWAMEMEFARLTPPDATSDEKPLLHWCDHGIGRRR